MSAGNILGIIFATVILLFVIVQGFSVVQGIQEQEAVDLLTGLGYVVSAQGAGFVPTTRQVIAGNGLTGGGDLSADRTFAVNPATGSGVAFLSGALSIRRDCGVNEFVRWNGTSWECSGGGSTDSFRTWDIPTGTDIVADSGTDTVTFTSSGGITISGTAASDSISVVFDPIVAGVVLTTRQINTAGGLTGGGDLSTNRTLSILDEGVTEPRLDVVDSPADEECLTFETTSSRLEWQACVGGSGVSVQELDTTIVASLTVLDFGAGFDVSESPADEANVILDFTEFSNLTWGNGSTFLWTMDVSGTDPAINFSSNAVNVATGVLSVGSIAVVLQNRLVDTGTGLEGGGDLSANRTLSIASTYRLPQGCVNNDVTKFSTGSNVWLCATDLTGTSNSFETIAGGVQSSGGPVVADSATDTLTLAAAGSGVSLTLVAGTDTITLSVTGAGTHAFQHNIGGIDEVGFYGLVQDEASDLIQRSRLNFTGTGVSCVDNVGGARTDCTVAATGSVSNSFETIAVPSGTNPVADSSVDTLTFAVTGTDVLIFGNSTTDTVNFDLLTHAGTNITADLEEEGEINTTVVSGNASGSGSADSVILGTATNTATWATLPDCVAGLGNHINYDAIVNSFLCGDTDTFATFAGGNQSSGGPIIAEIPGDTFTLGATGSGVSLSFNASTDTITLSVTGAGTHAFQHAVGAFDEIAYYSFVMNEGSDLTQRRRVNFIGGDINCVDNVGSLRTDCSVSPEANSFETIAVPSGTNPVADSFIDTLTFAVTGTDVLIFGTAGTDTINFDLLTHAGTNITADLEEEAQIGSTNITGNAADDQVIVGSGANAATWVTLGPCLDALSYSPAFNTFQCGQDFDLFAPGTQASGPTLIPDQEQDTITFSATGSGVSLSFTETGFFVDTITFSVTGAGTHSIQHSLGGIDEIGAYMRAHDEGIELASRRRLNFTGAGVSCVDNIGATRTDCTIGGGGSTNSFETIAGGAQTSGGPVVADSATDTLTLAATGSGVSLSLTAGTDTITFSVTGAGTRYIPREIIFGQDGDVSTTMNMENRRFTARRSGTIQDVLCRVTTAPTTSAVTVDVNLNGTTIFTTQANRPSIAAGGLFDISEAPQVTIYSSTQIFSLEIDATDSGNTAADLVCQILLWEETSGSPST